MGVREAAECQPCTDDAAARRRRDRKWTALPALLPFAKYGTRQQNETIIEVAPRAEDRQHVPELNLPLGLPRLTV